VNRRVSDELLVGMGGERLFNGFEAGVPQLELVRVLDAPGVAHLRFRVAG